MNKYSMEWINEWCSDNGWTDPFQERKEYWAFPPCAVMPLPIPHEALQVIKAKKGLSPEEKGWSVLAWSVAVICAVMGVWAETPMPFVAAFAVCAVIFGMMDDE